MKKYILAVTCVLAITLAVKAQSKDETAVRNVLEKQRQAWNTGDIDKFMEGYWHSDSLMFVGKSGVTYGWQNTMDNYKKATPILPLWANLSLIYLK